MIPLFGRRRPAAPPAPVSRPVPLRPRMAAGLDRLLDMADRAAADAVVQLAGARSLAAAASTALGEPSDSIDAAADAAERRWRAENPGLSVLADELMGSGREVFRW